MQENNTAEIWEEPLASDLWTIAKSFGEYTPEEEFKAWHEGVAVLEGFCQVADGLHNEPLILALVDAKVRAEEELERARDRAQRSEGLQVSESEQERLEAMWVRSNTLSNAIGVRARHDNPERGGYAGKMAVLEEMRREADEAFLRYRREIGLPE